MTDFEVTHNLADKSFYLDPNNFKKISDTSISDIIELLNLNDILKPNIYDITDPSTNMNNMEPIFLVLYAMDGRDFNELLGGLKPRSRAGSAIVQGKQNAHGIVTGHTKGWQSLSDTFNLFDGKITTVATAKQLIDLNFAWLYEKIKKGNYKRVVYPADSNGMWAHSRYNVNDDVRKYIIFKLIGLMCKDDVAAKFDQDLSQIYTCPN